MLFNVALALLVVQFEPPSNEYSILRYTGVPDELVTESVDNAEPLEQLPSDCELETVTGCGQSTVALADKAVGVNPVKLLEVSEEVTLQVIALPSPTA